MQKLTSKDLTKAQKDVVRQLVSGSAIFPWKGKYVYGGSHDVVSKKAISRLKGFGIIEMKHGAFHISEQGKNLIL